MGEPDFLRVAGEFVQNNLPCVGLVAIALIGFSGWITPFFSEDQRIEVVNRYRELTGHIRTARYLKKEPDQAQVLERRKLMIIRGAAFHSFIQKIIRN